MKKLVLNLKFFEHIIESGDGYLKVLLSPMVNFGTY